MLIERKVRAEFDRIWTSNPHPVRKARRFLVLSRRLKRLAGHLVELGFMSYGKKDEPAMRMMWASAAKFIHLAEKARDNARQALRGRPQKLGFDYAPQTYAEPTWASPNFGPQGVAS